MTKEARHTVPLGVRLFAELAVIIVGVLLALSADAWRESEREAAEEERHLAALRGDLLESTATLAEWTRTRHMMNHGLLRLLEQDLATVDPDSVSTWLHGGLWLIGIYEPRLAALRDLEATGEIRLLPPEIRLGLAELRQRLAQLERIEADVTTSQQGLIDPFLVTELPLAPVLGAADSLPISERLGPGLNWSSLRTDHARSLMAFKLSLMQTAFEEGEAFEEQLQHVLGLIETRMSELRQ